MWGTAPTKMKTAAAGRSYVSPPVRRVIRSMRAAPSTPSTSVPTRTSMFAVAPDLVDEVLGHPLLERADRGPPS